MTGDANLNPQRQGFETPSPPPPGSPLRPVCLSPIHLCQLSGGPRQLSSSKNIYLCFSGSLNLPGELLGEAHSAGWHFLLCWVWPGSLPSPETATVDHTYHSGHAQGPHGLLLEHSK